MNYIEINGGNKDQKIFTKQIIEWCIEELLPRVRTLDVTINLLNKLDGNVDGYQWSGENNRQHFIEINKNLCYDDYVTAVMHEMVHVKQDYRKDKRPIEEREKEAYKQQEILFERWKR